MAAVHPINIRYESTDVEIETPRWGYTVTPVMPFTIVHMGGLSWRIQDNGTAYDRRYLKCEWMLDKTLTDNLLDIFKNVSKGRGKMLTLKLGTSSGFYPFGPDKGDSGNFQCVLKSVNPKPSIGHPQDYFQTECEFMFTGSYPAYSLPTQINEGNLQIGTIANLRYPQNMHDQDIKYGVDVIETHDYSAYVNDRTAGADAFKAAMSLDLQGPNMAALINHLTGTVRANALNIYPPTNAYLFGRENGDGDEDGLFVCNWIDESFEIVHRAFNDFGVTLNFAKAA